jgi:hypothetical protein
MKTDEIIEMANQAKLCQCIWVDDEGPEIASLVAFAKLVAIQVEEALAEEYMTDIHRAIKIEREACAKVCDELHWPWHMGDNSGPKECAESIRARSGDEK